MKKECRFCTSIFYTEPDNFDKIVICNDCLIAIKQQLRSDPEFQKEVFKELKQNSDIKFEFLESALGDSEVIKKIAKAMLSLEVKEVGLGGSGSLAEFFR